MQTLHHLWSTLELSPGLSNVLSEWQRRLGPHFDIVRPWFRPTDRRATSLQCPRPGSGCLRKVVDYGDGEIIAVCNGEDQCCDEITLSPEEIIVHKLDLRTLSSIVANVLKIPLEFAPVEGFYQLFLVGKIQPVASQRFHVFLTIQGDKEITRNVVVGLLGKMDAPFVLMSLTDQSVDREMVHLIARNRSRITYLEDLLVWDDVNKALVGVESASEWLADFAKQAAPEMTQAGSMDYFPTPAGAHWEHFTFEFLADHALLVRCKGIQQPRQLEPEHLGMKNQINGRPTQQWIVLMALAIHGGQLSWKNNKENSKLKAQKQALSKKLRQYFLLDDEPIPWKRNQGAFETRFVLRQYRSKNHDWFQNEMSNLE